MERVKFVFEFDDVDDNRTDNKLIEREIQVEGGLKDYEICEAFLDFMNSAGYSEENIWNYFKR